MRYRYRNFEGYGVPLVTPKSSLAQNCACAVSGSAYTHVHLCVKMAEKETFDSLLQLVEKEYKEG